MGKQVISFKGLRQNKLYSYKEITGFSSDFNNSFFKALVLSQLAEKSNEKISKSNIWILDNSFKPKNQYKNLFDTKGTIDLSTSHGLKSLYHMGNPIALMANKEAYFLNVCFKFFGELQHLVNNSALVSGINKNIFFEELLKRLNRESLQDEIRNFLEEQKDFYFQQLKEVQGSHLLDEKSTKLATKLNTKLTQIFKKYIDLVQVENFESMESFSGEAVFRRIFRHHSQPIVIVKSDNDLFICGWDAVSREMFVEENDNFLETRRIQQQSPLFVDLAISCTVIAPFLIPALKTTWKKANQRLESEENKPEPDKDTTDKLETVIGNSKKAIDELSVYVPSTGTAAQNVLGNLVDDLSEDVTSSLEKSINYTEITVESITKK